jgi:hypothetical protein
VPASGLADPPLRPKPETAAVPTEPWRLERALVVWPWFVALPLDPSDPEAARLTPLTNEVVIGTAVDTGEKADGDLTVGAVGVVSATDGGVGARIEKLGVGIGIETFGVGIADEGAFGAGIAAEETLGVRSDTDEASGVGSDTEGASGVGSGTGEAWLTGGVLSATCGAVTETDGAFAETAVGAREADTDVPDSSTPQA